MMAIISMTKEEAKRRLKEAGVPRDISGDYHIIDILQALGLLHIQEDRLVIDHVDARPIIIKRNGKIVYEE